METCNIFVTSRYGLNRLKLSLIRACEKSNFLNSVRPQCRPMHVVVTRYLTETVDSFLNSVKSQRRPMHVVVTRHLTETVDSFFK